MKLRDQLAPMMRAAKIPVMQNGQPRALLVPRPVLHALGNAALALEDLSKQHHGFHLGTGPCVCTSHEAATLALAELQLAYKENS